MVETAACRQGRIGGGGGGGGMLTLLLDGCSLKGFGTGKFFLAYIAGGLWMVAVDSWCLLDGCCQFLVLYGWLLLIPGALWVVAIIYPQVAPETVNLQNFPGPQLRLPPALEEGEGGWWGV